MARLALIKQPKLVWELLEREDSDSRAVCEWTCTISMYKEINKSRKTELGEWRAQVWQLSKHPRGVIAASYYWPSTC